MFYVRSTQDAVCLFCLFCLAVAFVLMASGYYRLLRQAFRSENRREALRLVYDWRGYEHHVDNRGVQLIYMGARFGAIGFIGLTILLLPAILGY